MDLIAGYSLALATDGKSPCFIINYIHDLFYYFTSLLPVLEQDMTIYEMRALHGHVPLFSFILSHSLIHSLVQASSQYRRRQISI